MNRSRSSRRQFLSGEAALQAVGDAGGQLADRLAAADQAEATTKTPNEATANPSAAHDRDPATYLIQIGRRAMACQFDVFLNASEPASSSEQALGALDLLEVLEEQLSVYRQRSEITRLNGLAVFRPIEVERRLFELLELALRIHQETHGAFDITSGPLIEAWGFLRRQGKMPSDDEVRASLQRVGSQHIVLNPALRTVSFAREGLSVNLGAIGKGYALDRCAEHLTSHGVDNFMIHGGSSSLVARGRRQSGTGAPGWTLGIQHPLRADRRLAELQVCDRAVGTSGSGTQHFYHQGKRYGHILDPRTGFPADRVLSSTVVAPLGASADALSTAFFVLGVPGAEAYCRHHPEVSAILTTAGRRAGSVIMHAINAEAIELRRLDGADEHSSSGA